MLKTGKDMLCFWKSHCWEFLWQAQVGNYKHKCSRIEHQSNKNLAQNWSRPFDKKLHFFCFSDHNSC